MRACLVLLLAACSFEHGRVGATSPDANDHDAQPGCVSFSSQVDTCALAASDMDLTLTGVTTYDTNAGTLVAGTTPIAITHMQLAGKAGPLEVLIVRDFRMSTGAKLRATGTVPLAILAFGSIAIEANAAIDVSAGGAGARTTCAAGAINGVPREGGGGGGGGGGFAALGGSGGNGDADSGSLAAGGPGGELVAMPTGPLGGCPGAQGGAGNDAGGSGGLAGGAIYLVAAQKIEIAPGAGINAGGGGGDGGDAAAFSFGDAGGGGGGSGGVIWIESPLVRSAGTLAANGGGGGEASGGFSSGNGGETGALSAMPAAGGGGNSGPGTDGGNGGAQLAPQGRSVLDVGNGGGGGGGGSVGFIVVEGDDVMVAIASPDAI